MLKCHNFRANLAVRNMTAWDIRANLAVRNLKCSSVMTFRVIRGETRVLELKHVFKEL